MFLALIVKNGIFAYLTLKWTFWNRRWPWVIKIIQETECPVKITWKWGIALVPGFIYWKIIFDLEISGGHFVLNLVNDLSITKMTLDYQYNTVMHFQTKSHEKEVVHMFLALIVKNCIFAYLNLKLTFWPWRWPWIIKTMQEMDCPVKITWKWGITLVHGFICWKILFDLEISGGHFVFAFKKFRPRVSKWHPADSCSGHPIVSESIIKRRPYRETHFRQNLLDYIPWDLRVE